MHVQSYDYNCNVFPDILSCLLEHQWYFATTTAKYYSRQSGRINQVGGLDETIVWRVFNRQFYLYLFVSAARGRFSIDILPTSSRCESIARDFFAYRIKSFRRRIRIKIQRVIGFRRLATINFTINHLPRSSSTRLLLAMIAAEICSKLL